MRLSRKIAALAVAAATTMALAACGSGSAPTGAGNLASADKFSSTEKTTITFAGWSLSQTPEFQTLADGFHKAHPNVTVQLKQYSADDYNPQLTADISAGSQPDVFPVKNLETYDTFAQSNGMADLSDIAAGYHGNSNIKISDYRLDGKYYAMPYREDFTVVYYNKDIFKKTGVKEPTKNWTWDDYTKTAEALKKALPTAGYGANVMPLYEHNWQSVVQDPALAQYSKPAAATFFKGNFNYLIPYYNRALKWQKDKLTIDWNTSSTNKVQYQTEFGTQVAVMMPMGTWYIATLLAQQKDGQAQKFDWGLAPLPQNPDTKPAPSKPVSPYGPTGLAVSSQISGQRLAAAKEFVKWASGEGGAVALAKIGITPAYFSDKVTSTLFAVDGIATDAMTKYTWSTHTLVAQPPAGENSAAIVSLLGDAHSSIMTGSKSVTDALATATTNAKNQNLTTGE